MLISAALGLFAVCSLGAVSGADRHAHEQTLDHGGRELGVEESPINDAYMSTYEIVATWPHDPSAFTQGLVFVGKELYESDGLYRKSMVRHVDVPSGRSVKATANSAKHFGEGLAVVGDTLLQLTWQENVVNRFSLPHLSLVDSRTLPCTRATGGAQCHQGWGLASDGQRLYLTDSTDKLFTLHPETLEPLGPPQQIYDHTMGRAINGVNELEWVEGELWGNVYPMYQGSASECLVRINATDASVLGWVDLTGLLNRQRQEVRSQPRNLVLNGVAYHDESRRLYVTGKQWDKMYQVRIKPDSRHQSGAYANSICKLGPTGTMSGRSG